MSATASVSTGLSPAALDWGLAVSDDGGRVVKLYWASYPFTREPHAF